MKRNDRQQDREFFPAHRKSLPFAIGLGLRRRVVASQRPGIGPVNYADEKQQADNNNHEFALDNGCS